MAMHIKVRDIKTGAIYRYGAIKVWSVEQIADALVARVGFTPSTAKQLARHWHATDLYKVARGERGPFIGMPTWLAARFSEAA